MRKLFSIVVVSLLLCFAIPQIVFAQASLFFSPARANVTVGQRVTLTLVVNSGGDAVNSAQARIRFPNHLVTLESVDRASLFTLWPVGPSYDNAAGTIDFTGGLPTPGYAGPAGSILRAVFTAKQPGTAVISLENARVLLNDGFGTDALGSTGSAILVISPAPVRPEPEPEPEPEPQPARLPAPTVWSDTHANQESWYANPDPVLQWEVDGEAEGFSYSLDHSSGTIPDDESEGSNLSTFYQALEDGIWYFHIKARNAAGWSDTTHFRLHIDTTTPLPFSIRVEGDQPTTNPRPNIHFLTEDALSGIDRYEVWIDDGARTVVLPGGTQPYLLPELSYGTHTIHVLAFDRAGNIRASAVSLEVVKYAPESGFWFAGIFLLYSWIVIGVLVLGILVLLLILWLVLWRCRKCCECCNCEKSTKIQMPNNK